MTQRTTNLIIFVISTIITLIALAVFIYIYLTPEVVNREDLLIGTGIWFVSGVGLSLYIWLNRKNLRL